MKKKIQSLIIWSLILVLTPFAAIFASGNKEALSFYFSDSTTISAQSGYNVDIGGDLTVGGSVTISGIISADDFTSPLNLGDSTNTATTTFNTTVNGYLTIVADGDRVGIGTTSPAYPLDVDGDFRVGEEGSSNALFVNATAGRVGIGTDSPEALLDIYHNTNSGSVMPSEIKLSQFYTTTSDLKSSRILFDYYGSNYGSGLNTQGMHYISGRPAYADHWFMEDDGTVQMVIRDSGNVGIGTSTPAYLLDVDGDFRVGEEGSSDALFVDATQGRVGIGTDSPLDLLHVSSDSDPTIYISTVTSNQENAGKLAFGENIYTPQMWLRYDGSSNKMKIESSVLTNIATFDKTSGNVGIGTTSPAYLLDVDGDFRVGEEGHANVLFVDASTGNVGIGTTNLAAKLSIYGVDNKDTGPIMNIGGNAINQLESGRIRFTETPMSASPWYQGGYLHYDGGENRLFLGVHNNSTAVVADDIDAIGIYRENGNTTMYKPTTFSDKAIFNGNVGISTSTPETSLDVNGIIKTQPASSRTCNALAEGGIMYDSDDNHFYGCDGSSWIQLDN